MGEKSSYFDSGKVYVISSSHNDIAWLDSPLVTILFRNRNIIGMGIEMLEEDQQFTHSMESCLYLRDFVILNPQMKKRMHQLIKDKRYGWGATYTQPYESTLTGEGLVRQYYLGKRWLEKEFPGADIRTTWNQDVPGRTMQSAQIMKKCGVDYLATSRMNEGFYKWYSPDGSFVHGYSPGHYHENSISQIISLSYNIYDSEKDGLGVQANVESPDKVIFADLCNTAEKYHKQLGLPPLHCYVAIRDYDSPLNINKLLETLNTSTEFRFPEFQHSRMEEFMDEAVRVLDKESYWREYRGERPDEWVYMMPSHAQTFRENRHGLFLLDEAELFSTLDLMVNQTRYPSTEITQCWEKLLYLDHGFGGRNGHITDETYCQTSIEGRKLSESIRSRAIDNIDERIEVWQDGHYITLYNPLQWHRHDTLELSVNWQELGSVHFSLCDDKGENVPLQIIGEPSPYIIKILVSASLPAYGYKRLLLTPVSAAKKMENPDVFVEQKNSFQVSLENQFYKVELEEGGLISLFDKELQEELLASDFSAKFLRGFEVFMVHSTGYGAGEFNEVQQASFPDGVHGLMREKYGQFTGCPVRSSNYGMRWQIREQEGLLTHNGELVTILTGLVRFPHFILEQEIRFYHCMKKIDTNINIVAWDGTMYEEIRVALPLKKEFQEIQYEVPMGILRLGVDEVDGPLGVDYFTERNAPKRYPTICRDIHPREVQSWIGVESGTGAVLFSCCDTPVFDYGILHDSMVIQPILLASRHSCTDVGNPYSQYGNHSFSFTMTSGTGKIKEQIVLMENNKHKIIPTVKYHQLKKEGLPSTLAMIEVDGSIRVSAIKKCEDTDEIVVRVYEPYGLSSPFSMNFYSSIESIRRSNMLEEGGDTLKKDKLDDLLSPYAIETYCLTMNPKKT